MNKIMLLGRISKDLDVRYTQSEDKMIVRTSIAVNRRFKSQNGEYDVDFFEIVAFGKTAEFMNRYMQKGLQIAIVGRLQNNNYEDKEGKKHYSNIIVVEEVYFADSKKTETTANTTQDENGVGFNYSYDDDDLPF